jgi:hypothetical protein
MSSAEGQTRPPRELHTLHRPQPRAVPTLPRSMTLGGDAVVVKTFEPSPTGSATATLAAYVNSTSPGSCGFEVFGHQPEAAGNFPITLAFPVPTGYYYELEFTNAALFSAWYFAPISGVVK